MAKKIRIFIFSLLALALLGQAVPLPVHAAAKDFVIGKNNFHENGKYGQDGYFGPWWEGDCLSFESGVLVFDTSVENAWMTMNLSDDTLDSSQYKYMVVKIKTNAPAQAENFAMTIGKKAGKNGRKANCGKTLTEWTLADGSHPKPLTSQYATLTIDLAKSGVISFEGDPDFALNKGDAKNAKIYISELYLTNTNPGGGSVKQQSTPATTQPKPASSAPQAAASAAVSSSALSSDISSEESSAVSSEALSEASSAEESTVPAMASAVSSPAKDAPAGFDPAVIYIVLACVLGIGTIAAILVLSKKAKNK